MTSHIVEGTYENGMLKLDHPVPLGEHERVRIVVHAGAADLPRREPAPEAPAQEPSEGAPSEEEPSDFAESEMLNIWLDVPPSPAARIITATRGKPILPRPFIIDESDLTPE
jgi:predicted DNA-binding antitoxin AbrB/MazE fold protein